MLQGLTVKNFAIIDEIEVNFMPGLNVMTGETGSGKSILMGAVNCALGGKFSKEMIRHDAEYAYVELTFECNDLSKEQAEEVSAILASNSLPEAEGQILFSRRMMQNGRSVLKVNGEATTQAAVREIAEKLLDIHGQHEHQSLLYKKNHLEILDRYIKDRIGILKEELRNAYGSYVKCRQELEGGMSDRESRLREISFLEFEVNEIKSCHLMISEEEELSQRYRVLANARLITECLGACYRLTEEDDSSAASNISRAVKSLSKVTEYDEKISELSTLLLDAENILNDFNRGLADYLEETDNSEEELMQITERLDLIRHLEAKYGTTIVSVLDYCAKAEQKLKKYEDYDAYLEQLQQNCNQAETIVRCLSERLHSYRTAGSKELEQEITTALKELNFSEVLFRIQIDMRDEFSANGTEEAEFLIALNPGESIQPLVKVASGGELSRIMLAIKSVLADKDAIDSLIFDEIDTGISGRTAQKVSERLSFIAKNHQVLCITHLPQIAAMADHHYGIEKRMDGGRIHTVIEPLSEQESTEEIARLLGGVQITDSVLSNAKEMKLLAKEVNCNRKK